MPTTAQLASLLRYWSLESTGAAGSGHPSSCLSAADLMASLFFDGHFHFKVDDPRYQNNDRLIFSKGHAAPLFYALWAAAGVIDPAQLPTLRQASSNLQGHPGMDFPFTEAATGSLGQGLSIGAGIALRGQMDKFGFKTFVLLGDGELAEGNIYEALQLAGHYQLGNLIAVADINRLEQTGPTQLGHDLETYQQRINAFGWETIVIDGHNLEEISQAYSAARQSRAKPVMILAQTFKGRGVPILEDQLNWHGKALAGEPLQIALNELAVDPSWRGNLAQPELVDWSTTPAGQVAPIVVPAEKQSVRRAYGEALVRIAPAHPQMLVLDADLSNSTYSEIFKTKYPDQFLDMFIAEQNMVAMAVGLASQGKLPFVSTFGAFFSRAFDQIRMGAYSLSHIVYCGSHVGVSIGPDGVSQMGLEDIALFRSVYGSSVLYPADAVAMHRLVELSTTLAGPVYLRSTREETPLLYGESDTFPLGGSKTLRSSEIDKLTILAAGITVHQALEAADKLTAENLPTRVIDLYSVKPIDTASIRQAAEQTGKLIVVEDHYPEGGLGEAVRTALGDTPTQLVHLAVRNLPHSGTPAENLAAAGINSNAIVAAAHRLQ